MEPAKQSGWGPAKEWRNGKGQGVPSADGQAPVLPENHAKKKRPPRNNDQHFKDYYDAQLGQLTEEDREAMFKCLNEPLPVTFRLVGPLQTGSTADEANRYHSQLCDLLVAGTEEEGGLKLNSDALQRLKWYPHQGAWQLAIGKKEMKKVANLQAFLLQETAAGSLVRMEAVSMIPALVLASCPGDFVLDMCAAPGSKTGMCLEMVMHKRGANGSVSLELEAAMGAVVANDPDLQRSKMMVHRTKALCSPSLVVTALPGQAFPQLMSEQGDAIMFDRVLCDVPCSGDGTLRKAPYNLKTWHISHSLQYHLLQTLLLKRSIELIKVGGYIVYSTCSLNPIENEAVIAHVVAQADGAVEICECPASLAVLKRRPGLMHWRVPDANFPGKWYDTFDEVVAARTARGKAREAFSRRGLIRSMFCSSKPDGCIRDEVNGESGQAHLSTRALGIQRCIRILPHDNDSGAFFVTLLRKKAHVTFALPIDPEAAAEAEAATAAATGQAPPLTVGADTAGAAPASGAPPSDAESEPAVGGPKELPKDFVDHCTRLTRMEARVQKVEPYMPLERMPNGDAAWQSIAQFYGVSSGFPSSQLLAHSERLKTIHYVTAAARRALQAAQPSAMAGGKEYTKDTNTKDTNTKDTSEPKETQCRSTDEMLNVVVAGTKMFEKDECEHCPCAYRVCMDGLPFLLPFLSDKRLVRLGRELVEEILEKRLAPVGECPAHLQAMETGSLIGVCEVSGTALALWKGKSVVKLFVSSDDAASLLARLRTL